MNKASRIVPTINSQANPFQLRASLFHCTPVSERRRRTHWDSVRPLICLFVCFLNLVDDMDVS